jgi:predicted enzyme involved in methoxymalonyl-ACP biosynthesis
MQIKKDFNSLKKNLKKDFSYLKKVKVALLGDTATQFLKQALRATGFDQEFDLNIWEADFNQIERQIFDPESELYKFEPEVVIVFQSTHKLLGKYNKLNPILQNNLADIEIELITNLYSHLQTNLSSKVIFYNYTEINDSVYGNYANKVESSFLFQLRKLNYELMKFTATNLNFHLADISSIQNRLGKVTFFHTSVYINTEMTLSIDILPEVASITIDLIGAMYGKVKKCLILDLDNTIWGGIIGDDGLENIQLGSLGIGKLLQSFNIG